MNEKIKRRALLYVSFSLDFLERGTFTEYPYLFFIIFIMNIYVGNLNYRVKEGDLQQVMEDYGAVSSVKVIMDRETGKSKGFAFIEMEDDAAAAKAIAELNGAEYMGRTMVVKEARPKA